MAKIDFSEFDLFTTRDGRKINYEDLLCDIYENAEESRAALRTMVEQMVSLINSPQEAVALMEHITTLMDTRVKNDDILVKLAAMLSRVIQRSMEGKEEGGTSEWLTDAEKKQLLQEAEEALNKRSVVKG